MPLPTSRWLAIAVVVFLFAQPIPFSALAQQSSDASCCCKNKTAGCCRRSHKHALQGEPDGPAFSSRDCCDQCQVSVRRSQPAAEMAAPAARCVELAPSVAPAPAWAGWIPSPRHDPALFERPPPYAI
jgi:hypothetical protein